VHFALGSQVDVVVGGDPGNPLRMPTHSRTGAASLRVILGSLYGRLVLERRQDLTWPEMMFCLSSFICR
jgi:hypothetical protein